MTYYKFLTADGCSPYANYEWPLPTEDRPGEWVEVEGELVECKRGIHACRQEDLLHWLDATLYELEYAEPPEAAANKVFGRSARLVRRIPEWDDRTARMLAADFAEHVAHLWEAPDRVTWVPADTISVVRRYAEGDATREELDAAYSAAYSAASSAARSATNFAAHYAASSAADSAAYSFAERDWQTVRLAEVLGLEVGQ